jgi:hypothetical protein
MKHGYAIIVVAGALAGAAIGCADSAKDEGPASVSPPIGAGGAMGNLPNSAGTGASGQSARPPINSGNAGTGMSAGTSAPTPTGGSPSLGGTGAAGMVATTGGAGGSMTEPEPRMGDTCLQAGNGMYTEQGPYQVGMMDVDLGMIEASQHTGKFTIFYPMPLEGSCKHPIVVWGNGTTVMGSGTYAFFNNNAASWGMVVAASHEDNTGSGNHHKAGIDWLLAQNEDSSSMFYQKLSTRVGVSGHSQGGFGASRAFTHANVETAVIVGATARASEKVSVIILTGTEDIASGAMASGAGKMFVASWEGGDHVGTQTIAGYISRDPGTLQMQRFYAAWFRCFLADDQTACDMFYGGTPTGCGICSDMGWAVLSSVNMM